MGLVLLNGANYEYVNRDQVKKAVFFIECYTFHPVGGDMSLSVKLAIYSHRVILLNRPSTTV